MNWNDIMYQEYRRQDFEREAAQWRLLQEVRKGKPSRWQQIKARLSSFQNEAEETASTVQTTSLVSSCVES